MTLYEHNERIAEGFRILRRYRRDIVLGHLVNVGEAFAERCPEVELEKMSEQHILTLLDFGWEFDERCGWVYREEDE